MEDLDKGGWTAGAPTLTKGEEAVLGRATGDDAEINVAQTKTEIAASAVHEYFHVETAEGDTVYDDQDAYVESVLLNEGRAFAEELRYYGEVKQHIRDNGVQYPEQEKELEHALKNATGRKQYDAAFVEAIGNGRSPEEAHEAGARAIAEELRGGDYEEMTRRKYLSEEKALAHQEGRFAAAPPAHRAVMARKLAEGAGGFGFALTKADVKRARHLNEALKAHRDAEVKRCAAQASDPDIAKRFDAAVQLFHSAGSLDAAIVAATSAGEHNLAETLVLLSMATTEGLEDQWRESPPSPKKVRDTLWAYQRKNIDKVEIAARSRYPGEAFAFERGDPSQLTVGPDTYYFLRTFHKEAFRSISVDLVEFEPPDSET
ncbi:MAG: hypothetical protein JRI25_17940 [Deltaproteobacteria bacterium]|nr:hypothetical protein [Deltaproteobacteria bacterium]